MTTIGNTDIPFYHQKDRGTNVMTEEENEIEQGKEEEQGVEEE